MSQGYRRKRKSHRKLVYLFLVEIIIILVLLFVLFIPSKVHRKVSVEAGAKLTNVELFLKDNQKGKFVTDMTKIDANNIGKTTILKIRKKYLLPMTGTHIMIPFNVTITIVKEIFCFLNF